VHVGVSTIPFRHERLCRDQLEGVARLGFVAIDLFASCALAKSPHAAERCTVAAGVTCVAIRTVGYDGP
jgi:hypothetical protein